MAPEEVMETMSDGEFRKYVLTILNRELGPCGFARYLRTRIEGSGDYTRDRHLWLDQLSMDEVLADVGLRMHEESASYK